jgi:stage II sporulation SpoE-like protein
MRGQAGRGTRSALAAALAVGALFGLQSLPSASAAKAGGAGTAEPGSRAAHRAERSAAKAEGATPAPPVSGPVEAPVTPQASQAHGHRGQPAPVPATPAQPGAGAAARKGDHAGHGQHRDERRAESTSLTSPATSTGAGATAEESSSAQAEALAAKQKKGGKGKKQHKEKGKKAEEPQPEEAGGESTSGESTSGLSAKAKGSAGAGGGDARATAAAASATAPVSAQPVAAGTVSLASATAPARSEAAGAPGVNSGRRAARRRHKTRKATAARRAAPLASIAPTASTATATTPAARSGSSAAGPVRKHSTQPAIVKTLTKIVGVVPTAVWALIAGLIVLALLLGARSLLAGVRTRRLVRQRGQLLEDVGLLQAALLPVPPERLGPVATSVAYRPADGPGAGGDFYDVFAREDGEIAVIVGDVSGHGREALPHTALLRFTVRAYLEAGLSPRRALQTAGTVLERQLGGSFATVVAATYNPRKRTLTYAGAGHPPPVVIGEGGEGARVHAPLVTSCAAPPIGAGMPTGTRQTVVSVPGPARLCFHTDGVTEARIAGELYGAERLGAALAGLPREADATALLERVAEQSDARPDDMAACLLRVHDGHGAPTIALEQLELSRELVAGPRVERFLRDCGLEPAEAQGLVHDARRRLQRVDTLMLELERGADGRMIASLAEDNVIHAAALATAGVS